MERIFDLIANDDKQDFPGDREGESKTRRKQKSKTTERTNKPHATGGSVVAN